MVEARELWVLRWLSGPQPFHPAASAYEIGEMRERGFARDEVGRIVLTDAGRQRLADLEAVTR